MQQLETHKLHRRVDQAILHTGNPEDRPGDCLRAAMATVFDRPLLEVPHFVETPGSIEDFWAEVRGFVHRVTFGTHFVECYDASEWLEWDMPAQLGGMEYALILTGPSPRSVNGEFSHAVVADPRTLEVLHDPHPSRAGVTSRSQVYAMVKA